MVLSVADTAKQGDFFAKNVHKNIETTWAFPVPSFQTWRSSCVREHTQEKCGDAAVTWPFSDPADKIRNFSI